MTPIRKDQPPNVAQSLTAAIVTHNSAAVIASCISALRKALPGTSILIVDNASSDDTTTRALALDGVRLIANRTNIGFARACNQAAETASTSHIMFLNPDVVLLSVDRAILIDELTRKPFGLLSPLFQAGRGFAPAWPPDSDWPYFVHHAVGYLLPRELARCRKGFRSLSKRWPSGAMLLCSCEEFARLGGFAREYFLYYEDRDLARRYQHAGLPLRVTPALVAQHNQGTSSRGDSVRIAAAGWEYLSWLEFLSRWNGYSAARRSAAYVTCIRCAFSWALGLVQHVGRLGQRAQRKKSQVDQIAAFVRWQSSGAKDAADAGFCPHARKIVSDLAAKRAG